ncbi:MAG: serine--tRNA ligase [Thaumarchaeota archaeon]|nr:serine--tRNA ligase [Nitrososphaerota archaeon]
MLDPKIIKEKPNDILNMLNARGVKFDLDALTDSNKKRLAMIAETDILREKKNQIAQEISQKKKNQQDASGMISEMKGIAEKLAELELEQRQVDEKYLKLALTIPNMIDKSVPIGDESANVVVRKWGEIPKFDFDARNHIDISEERSLVDMARAAKVSGARFYYLRNDMVRLNQSLIQYSLDFLAARNYSLVQPPYMINRQSMQGAVIADDFEDVIYKIEGEDLYMIGTSEHAMAAMHSGEIIKGADVPLRYAGVSPCFRKEAGAHGRDQKGIFRVHQFEKVEQFVFAKPEESWAEHERMLSVAEEFYQSLEIPHRVVLLSSVDMGKVSAKTYDIEAWMAGQGAFREIVSCSNCLDYQARRLKIRVRENTNEETQYIHTLNSTLVATSRVLVALVENFQTKDGHIKIPQVLQGYMGGQKEI